MAGTYEPLVAGDAADVAAQRQTRFLARQPICNKRREVVAYELLCRSGWDNSFSGDQDEGTRQMLDNILVVGADWLSLNNLAFINCTREALVGELVSLVPSRHVVLEILNSVAPDAEVVEACTRLKQQGYRLALDNFFVRDDMAPLLALADYVKVDLRACDARAREGLRSHLSGCSATLVAEKVETEQDFAAAVQEGYGLFQGYFFCHPTILPRDEVRTNHLNHLRLLTALGKSPLDYAEIEQIVMADAPLCFRLLRIVNSPIYGMRTEIRSVRRALVLMGDQDFRKLATVAIAGILGKNRPHALLALSLQRARLCELLAPHLHQDPVEQYLLGLFSLMDAILETPMAAIVSMLPLRPAVRSALLGEQNFTASPLRIARSYESGDWSAVSGFKEIVTLGSDRVNRMCLEAASWAETVLSH